VGKFGIKDTKGVIPPMMIAFGEQGNVYEERTRNIACYLARDIDGGYPRLQFKSIITELRDKVAAKLKDFKLL